jgi:hypothetical protein
MLPRLHSLPPSANRGAPYTGPNSGLIYTPVRRWAARAASPRGGLPTSAGHGEHRRQLVVEVVTERAF